MLSELIPCFRAPRATALPSCTDCGGRDPGSEALAGILLRTGTSAPARHPCKLTSVHYHSEIPGLRRRCLHGNVLSTWGVFDGRVSWFDVGMHNACIIFEFAREGGTQHLDVMNCTKEYDSGRRSVVPDSLR